MSRSRQSGLDAAMPHGELHSWSGQTANFSVANAALHLYFVHCDIDEPPSSVVPSLGVSSLDLGRSATPDGLFSFGLRSRFRRLPVLRERLGRAKPGSIAAVCRDSRRQVRLSTHLKSAAAQHTLSLQVGDLSLLVAHSGRFLPRLEPPQRAAYFFVRSRYSAAARRSAERRELGEQAAAQLHQVGLRACAKRGVGSSVCSSRYSARLISICSAWTPVLRPAIVLGDEAAGIGPIELGVIAEPRPADRAPAASAADRTRRRSGRRSRYPAGSRRIGSSPPTASSGNRSGSPRRSATGCAPASRRGSRETADRAARPARARRPASAACGRSPRRRPRCARSCRARPRRGSTGRWRTTATGCRTAPGRARRARD